MIKPIGDRVVIELEKQEEKTGSGIILPDSAKEKQFQGRVVAVGKGEVLASGDRSPMDLEEGDVVILPEFGGSQVKYNGVEYLIIREKEVLAIIR